MPGGGPRGLFGALHGSAKGGGASDQVVLGGPDLATLPYGAPPEEEVDALEAEDGLKDQVELERPRVGNPPPLPPPLEPPLDPPLELTGGGDDLEDGLFPPLLEPLFE